MALHDVSVMGCRIKLRIIDQVQEHHVKDIVIRIQELWRASSFSDQGARKVQRSTAPIAAIAAMQSMSRRTVKRMRGNRILLSATLALGRMTSGGRTAYRPSIRITDSRREMNMEAWSAWTRSR